MVPYPEYGIYDIPFKYFTFKRPVRRSLEFTLRVTGYPEIGPYQEAVAVGGIKEFLAGRYTASAYPHKIDVRIAAEAHLMIIPG